MGRGGGRLVGGKACINMMKFISYLSLSKGQCPLNNVNFNLKCTQCLLLNISEYTTKPKIRIVYIELVFIGNTYFWLFDFLTKQKAQ